MKTEYQIIAVDFDGTLCTDCFPKIGQPNTALIELLKGLRRQGRQIILWTCRCGNQLEEAVEWCRKWELEFDAVNENLPEIIERYGSDGRKIYADVYIDDKSCFPWEVKAISLFLMLMRKNWLNLNLYSFVNEREDGIVFLFIFGKSKINHGSS